MCPLSVHTATFSRKGRGCSSVRPARVLGLTRGNELLRLRTALVALSLVGRTYISSSLHSHTSPESAKMMNEYIGLHDPGKNVQCINLSY